VQPVPELIPEGQKVPASLSVQRFSTGRFTRRGFQLGGIFGPHEQLHGFLLSGLLFAQTHDCDTPKPVEATGRIRLRASGYY